MGDGIVYNEVWDNTAEVKGGKVEESEVEEGGIKKSEIDMGEVNDSEVEVTPWLGAGTTCPVLP